MVKLTSTYNFAKISKKVYVPEWYDKVSIDRPFSDGQDGIIEVKIRNVSPLFTRDGTPSTQVKDKRSNFSSHIVTSDNKRLYYLPATSIKGMLRSVMETLSFGKMQQYDERFFGHREFGKTSGTAAYQKKMQNVKGGWLIKDDDKFLLAPCDGIIETIPIKAVNKMFDGFNMEKSSWKRNMKLNFYPKYKNNNHEYYIVATGKIDGKNVEYLFPTATLSSIEVPEKVATAFTTIHEQTPDFENYLKRLERGERIAVFYISNNGKIEAIGLSKNFKLPYTNSVSSILSKQQEKESRPDLTDIIFGYISKSSNQNSLKGRVHIGNAFAQKAIADQELYTKFKGILGQPKPSFYPLYLKQDRCPYKTYYNADGIAGRKLYRIHQNSNISAPLKKDNANTETEFWPLPPGQEFKLRITVHNLRPIEIGALLSALTFHNTKGCFHNLGQAKGFGYGKIEIMSVDLKNLPLSMIDYLKKYEKEMSKFTMIEEKKMWHECEEPKSVMQIMSEHNDKEVEMMLLERRENGKKKTNDFREISKEENFSTLYERPIFINSLLNKDEQNAIKDSMIKERMLAEQRAKEAKARNNYKELLIKASKLKEESDYLSSLSLYRKISENLRLSGTVLTDIEEAIINLESIIHTQEMEAEKERIREDELAKQKKLQAGFDAFINEKYEDGRFKVTSYKTCRSKIQQWLKKNDRSTLDEKEKQIFTSVVNRLKANPDKKEIKEWKDTNSKIWKDIKSHLGEKWERLT